MTLLIVLGSVALFGAMVVGMLGLTGVPRTAGAAQRGIVQIETTYRAGPAPTRDSPFGQRVALPFARRLGGIGRAITPRGMQLRLQRWLDQAGNPSGWTAEVLLQAKGIALVFVGGFGGLVGLISHGLAGFLLGGLIAGAIGFLVPDVITWDLGIRRQHKIQRSLPDVLDMLTISVEAGLGFDAALSQVANQVSGPVAGEFARMLAEMRIGKGRSAALRAMAARTSVPELRAFTAAVVQASDLGIPVATVLREQSKEMRIKRRQRAEELAQKVPVKILFPLILFIFPALIIVILGPAIGRLLSFFAQL